MPDHSQRRGVAATSTDSAASRRQRGLTLLAGVALLGTFLHVLWRITDVVGGRTWLVAVVAAALLAATVAARFVPLTVGLGLGAGILGAGLVVYLDAVPTAYEALITLRIAEDVLALLGGEMSVLQVARADVWAVAIAPAPAFATWYLLLRRRYALAGWVGGLALGFFVLTGDANETVATVGVTAALAVLGLGSLEGTETWDVRVGEVGLVLAATVVLTRLLGPVTASALATVGGSSGADSDAATPGTVEANLIGPSGRVDVVGSISLSPAVRFEVTAERAGYWHVAAYDRYLGGGWVRSGESTAYDGPLDGPPGESETVAQRFVPATETNAMPSLWKPVRVDSSVAGATLVTDVEGLQPNRPLARGEAYEVTSERPRWTVDRLREAADGMPARIETRYLQVPSSTPARLGEFAAELTAEDETAYEKALRVEQWLKAEKGYSLSVPRPDGDVASAFVFEMDRGYCVHYATAMVALLRTVGVPARFAVGYTTGQPVGDGRWVVRGFNAHAWVEVFFPAVGWVTFDPTPGGPRQRARRERLARARRANEAGVDTAETRPSTPTPTPTAGTTDSADGESTATDAGTATAETPTATPTPETERIDGATGGGPDATLTSTSAGEGEDEALSRRALVPRLSAGDRLALLAAVVGVAIGVGRLEVLGRGYRIATLYWQPTTESPETDVRRAFERLETALARRYRARRSGETRRTYLRAVQAECGADGRLDRVLAIYERTVYAGEGSRESADEARRLVTELVRAQTLSRVGADEE